MSLLIPTDVAHELLDAEARAERIFVYFEDTTGEMIARKRADAIYGTHIAEVNAEETRWVKWGGVSVRQSDGTEITAWRGKKRFGRPVNLRGGDTMQVTLSLSVEDQS